MMCRSGSTDGETGPLGRDTGINAVHFFNRSAFTTMETLAEDPTCRDGPFKPTPTPSGGTGDEALRLNDADEG